ncbi:MAG: hypothetical protein WCK57_01325 [Verrucomicrobiae bacterium]
MNKLLIIAALTISTAGLLQAADAPFFQASLTPDMAIYTKTTEIRGLSLGVWNENPQQGIALGLVNGSTGDSSGFTWGFFANYDESYTGVAWGMVNYSKVKFIGWQAGMVNVAKEFHGLQWGFVNYSESLRGVQIGFANIAMNNPWFKEFPDKLATGFPIVNWSF